MARTSSTQDAFARRGAPAADPFASSTDHFKRGAKPAADHFKSSGGSQFSRGSKGKLKQDAFAPKQPAPPKPAAAKAPPPEPAAASAPPEPEVTVAAPEPAAIRRPALHIVPAESRAEPEVQPVLAEVTAAKPSPVSVSRPAARSSSMVLVAAGGVAAASGVDTLEKPAPVETPPPQPKAETPAPPATPDEPPRAGGGGGGGDGSGSGGSGGPAASARKRGLDQDDIVGIVLGLVILALLILWLLRGKEGGEDLATDDPLASTQFAATDTGPPAPFTPLVDPFGDQPVDLTPKGPVPEAAPAPAEESAAEPDGTEMAQLESAPPPAPAPTRPAAPPAAAAPPPVAAARPTPAPVALPAITSHAWFCTGSAQLTDAARADLLASIADFRPHAGEPLVVHAFADTRGTSVFNLALSGARARVVADFLRANGLTVSEFEGLGELDGLADGRNCANQRRADIFFKAGSDYRPSAACVAPEEKSAAICS